MRERSEAGAASPARVAESGEIISQFGLGLCRKRTSSRWTTWPTAWTPTAYGALCAFRRSSPRWARIPTSGCRRGKDTGGHFKGAHSTAILVHRKLIDYVDYSETRHDLRVSSVVLREQAGHQGNLLWVQLFSAHMESAIGHDWDELDQTSARVRDMMQGKRFMKIVGADMNGELIKTHTADVGRTGRAKTTSTWRSGTCG